MLDGKIKKILFVYNNKNLLQRLQKIKTIIFFKALKKTTREFF